MSYLHRLLLVIAAVSLTVITLSFARTDDAEALHITSSVSWQNPTVVWCFEGSMPSSWQTEYTQATNTWSNPSNWFLAYTQNCTGGAGAKIWMWRKSFSQNPGYGTNPGRTFRYWSGNYMTASFHYLNTDKTWTLSASEGASMGSGTNQCNPSCDVETVILHEIGHSAKFEHPPVITCPSPDPKSVMCVDYVVRRPLTAHDIEAAQWVY